MRALTDQIALEPTRRLKRAMGESGSNDNAAEQYDLLEAASDLFGLEEKTDEETGRQGDKEKANDDLPPSSFLLPSISGFVWMRRHCHDLCCFERDCVCALSGGCRVQWGRAVSARARRAHTDAGQTVRAGAWRVWDVRSCWPDCWRSSPQSGPGA